MATECLVLESRVAGMSVTCRTELAEVAACFGAVFPPTVGSVGEAGVVYEVKSKEGTLCLTCLGQFVCYAQSAARAVAAMETDLSVHAEVHNPRSLWLHAAALVSPSGQGLLCVGPSGSGKSTISLLLLDHGFRYLAEDSVLFEPTTKQVLGLGLAIRLDALPSAPEHLLERGFVLSRETRWERDDAAEAFRVRPPKELCWSSAEPVLATHCVFLERGPAALETRTAGQAFLGLWPERFHRQDGTEPWTPPALAAALPGMQYARLVTAQVSEVTPMLTQWMKETG